MVSSLSLLLSRSYQINEYSHVRLKDHFLPFMLFLWTIFCVRKHYGAKVQTAQHGNKYYVHKLQANHVFSGLYNLEQDGRGEPLMKEAQTRPLASGHSSGSANDLTVSCCKAMKDLKNRGHCVTPLNVRARCGRHSHFVGRRGRI